MHAEDALFNGEHSTQLGYSSSPAICSRVFIPYVVSRLF
jgi:hypothetical protein